MAPRLRKTNNGMPVARPNATVPGPGQRAASRVHVSEGQFIQQIVPLKRNESTNLGARLVAQSLAPQAQTPTATRVAATQVGARSSSIAKALEVLADDYV